MVKKILDNKLIKAALLFTMTLVVFGSLFSHSPYDQSLNTASSFEPANMFSYFGSYLSDAIIQFFGFSGWLFVAWGVILSINIIRHNPKRVKLKILASFLSVSFFSVIMGCLFPDFATPSHKYLIDLFKNSNQAIQLGSLIFLSFFSFFLFIYASSLRVSDFSAILSLSGVLFRKKELDHDDYYTRARPEIKTSSYFDKKKRSGVQNTSKEDDFEYSKKISKNRSSSSQEFILPMLDLLSNIKSTSGVKMSSASLQIQAERLLGVLNDFGVRGNIIQINQGPVVTLYEFEPAAGTKSSRVISLSDDIARSLCALSARIAVIPGRNVLGIELPNDDREFFRIRELVESAQYRDTNSQLPIILGKDISGKPTIVDLAKMPHLLVAGTTGSGKSVAINTMILSLLFKHSPKECRFIMIDPKMLELSVYDGIPHLLAPVVVDPGKAVVALKWAVREMENRYRLMSNLGVRNIHGYNERIKEAIQKKEELTRTVQTGFDPDTGKPIYESVPVEMEQLPFLVVIVDEMADLMLVAGKDIESSIQRLAQMARAAGIHLIMATQRPSVDVITGVIKANFPSRVSFKVTSKIDSRTILGEQGAEQLLGMGDMLYMGNSSRIVRVHGPFVEDMEVERISRFLKEQGTPDYIEAVTSLDDEDDASKDAMVDMDDMSDEGLYKKAVQIVKNDRKSSTSYIQRVLRIGYNRAAILIERMEKEGILSRPNHTGKREILIYED
ncbi:MAG: DNA translocase FtsK 4TM domain-containing protein [Rickettsiaceae bacterium]|nr:DNA translocase FtsK 4TM domain-containing protein [Rickettsiaceae bacterium]